MANLWDDYADYDAEATVALRLAKARQMAAALRQSITANYRGDGLGVDVGPLERLLEKVQLDIRRYERQSRRTRSMPIRAVNRL